MAKRAKSISNLQPGETVHLKFHGSKQIGNDPYELTETFQGFSKDGQEAEFESFTAYRFNRGWAYGSGAHKLTIRPEA